MDYGRIYYNNQQTRLNQANLKIYQGTNPVFGFDIPRAIGGTITVEGDYYVHTFTDSGSIEFNIATTANYMIVGGGGRASYFAGAGGGDVVTGSYAFGQGSSYNITIGAGGSGSQYIGGDSSIATINTAYGGHPQPSGFCNAQLDKYRGGYNTLYSGSCGDGYYYGGAGAGAGENGRPLGEGFLGGDGLAVTIANRSATYYGGGGGAYYAVGSGSLGGQGGGGQGGGLGYDGKAATFYGGGSGGGGNSS